MAWNTQQSRNFCRLDLRDVRAKHEQELAELETLKQRMLSSDRRRIQSTEEGFESEKQKVESAKKDREELSRRVAEEVQAEIQEETTKSKRNRSSFAAMVSAAVGVLGFKLFFNLDQKAQSELTQWFSDFSLSDFISNLFSS
jgi:hypothetical protein